MLGILGVCSVLSRDGRIVQDSLGNPIVVPPRKKSPPPPNPPHRGPQPKIKKEEGHVKSCLENVRSKIEKTK